MNDAAFLRPWITFAGGVLVFVVLWWARVLFEPIALAVLLTFLLAPIVKALQRWIGRVAAVVMVTVLMAGLAGGMTWGLTRQLGALAEDLPEYRVTILAKLRDFRRAQNGGSLTQIQRTVRDIQAELATTTDPTTARRSAQAPASNWTAAWDLSNYMDPVANALGFAGLVSILVIFMLLEREQLRDKFLKLVGDEQALKTTRALDEAGRRISRYLLIQLTINSIFGVAAGVGLWAIGVPLPLLWGAFATVLRFIPYVGPFMAAAAPVLVAFAALPGWQSPLLVVGLFTVLELITNLILETYFFAGAAGVSQTALLISIAIWTWLWGPLGLVLATPLTVCFVVFGRHIPSMQFITTMMADERVDSEIEDRYESDRRSHAGHSLAH